MKAPGKLVRAFVGACAIMLLTATLTSAQTRDEPRDRAGLRGLVVDAERSTPLAGATLTLDPLPGGAMVGSEAGVAGFVALSLQAVTGADGRYRFDRLEPGRYRMHVVRIGYRPATVEVYYDGPADPRVSVGLVMEPVELEPIDVVAYREDDIGGPRPSSARADSRRLELERLRQNRFVQGDARVLGDDDLVESATLGETDLLRALHRLPGVAADDDWSAEPWTRGARWDETRVYFDGLPLFGPFHVGGAFTGVSPDAVGAMTFLPGLHPVELGSASAGVVDLRSRRATGPEELSALAQVSLISGRFSVQRPFGGGSGLSIAGRRTYIDRVTREEVTGRAEDWLPYRFTDISARWDQVIADRLKLEVSGLETEDRVFGEVSETLKGARGRWGQRLLRGTLESTHFGLRGRLTVGRAIHDSDIESVPYDAARIDLAEATTAAPLDNEIRTGLVSLTVAPLRKGAAPEGWRVGVESVDTEVRYEGPAPWPYPGSANEGTLIERTAVGRWAYWGELDRMVSEDVRVSAGLRLEQSSQGGGLRGGLEAAPRLAVSWRPSAALRLSAGVGRHLQHEQALAAAGFTVGPGLVPTHLWVSAREGIPVLRSDIGTAGAELWLADGWLLSANAYLRRTDGRLTPDPDSGYVRARPALDDAGPGAGWVIGTVKAAGVEIGARRLVGRWNGSVSYSLSRARMDAGARRFPSPGERTHVFDAAILGQLTEDTRVGATYTLASGAPFTRFYSFRCPEDRYCPPPEPEAPPVIGFNEAAGGQRAPGYESMDVHVETKGEFLGLSVGFFAQLRNVLGRSNRSAYIGSVLRCDDVDSECTITDRFEPGMPFLPLLGLWIRL